MPTYERLPRFNADWQRLTDGQRERFRRAVGQFIDDLTAKRPFRNGLRVRRVQATSDIFELTFAPDGRATWQYGSELHAGEPHIIWRRIGTHDVFHNP